MEKKGLRFGYFPYALLFVGGAYGGLNVVLVVLTGGSLPLLFVICLSVVIVALFMLIFNKRKIVEKEEK
jgi:hypothetical protein